ncbi:MAG: ATP synthase F1 subunit delta [Bacteroidetes bacterium]|nr:ATP synthase F1 subunit delta [Bacteroidota bacterium]
MKGTKSASRYAKALLELAIEQNKVDLVLKDMEFFVDSGNNNYDLLVFLKSPVIKAEKKLSVLNELYSHFDSLSKSFIQLITKNGREVILVEIASSFIYLVKEYKGIVSVVLISATELTKTSKEKILSKIKVSGTIELTEEIDPTLIGGFIIRIGDVQVDASVNSQLKKLKIDLITNN